MPPSPAPQSINSSQLITSLLPADMQHIQSALEVRLKDTSSATLQDVLRFCYTAECHLTPDNVLPICALAEHFDVKALHSACVQFIEHNISVSSCCTMLEMAAQYNMEALRKASAVPCLPDLAAAAAAADSRQQTSQAIQSQLHLSALLLNCIEKLGLVTSAAYNSVQSEQRNEPGSVSQADNCCVTCHKSQSPAVPMCHLHL